MDSQTRLAVGLPVYNGDNYLSLALEAILGQTFEDFVVIVSDNASTDGTADIVAKYAARDSRIITLRHETNLGAAPNYNAAFEHAPKAEYFVWVAHDDVPHRTFFEEAIRALDARPEAVGAFARAEIIDPAGDVIDRRDPRPLLASDEAHVRYADVIEQRNQMHPVFGVMRTSALEQTGLHRGYTGSDRTLVAELAMLGPLIELPDYLFSIREHRDRSVRATKTNRDAWFDTSRTGKIGFPHWRRTLDFWRATRLTSERGKATFDARREFVRWLVPHGHWKQLAYDTTLALRALSGKTRRRSATEPTRPNRHRPDRERPGPSPARR